MSKFRPGLTPERVSAPKKRGIDAKRQEKEVDILARTIWGEARGEGELGMTAVACVILNRVQISKQKGGVWWGNDLIGICQKPYQFSCWNINDPNREKLLTVTERDIYFATALRIAKRGVLGFLVDVTGGATHYHAKGISPYWARSLVSTASIGQHMFYKDV